MKREIAVQLWIVTVAVASALGCGSSSNHAADTDAGQPSPDGSTTSDVGAGLTDGSAPYFETSLRLQSSCNAGSCLCAPLSLAPDSNGEVACSITFVLASGDTCSAHGLSPAAADVAASVQTFAQVPSSRAVCVFPQIPASAWTNGSCAGSPQAGWCYATGAAAQVCSAVILVSATGTAPSGASAVLACGATSPGAPPQGTSSASVGTACTPSQELSPTFPGFDEHEVSLDESNAACAGDVCLVNHFQGLTSCVYGQAPDGGPSPGSDAGCTLPGSGARVVGEVQPQCEERRTSAAVYCSCRCANTNGETNDGATYCACPGGYSCTQVVPASQPGDPRAGAYCVKSGTMETSTACSDCSASFDNCP